MRLGRFSISRWIVENDFDAALSIMSKCVVVRCEMMYASNSLEYFAISNCFDDIEDGVLAPEYEVVIDGADNGIKFVRII